MVKIRLQRFGTKKRPFYRVVAAESTRARDGRFIELIGTFDPRLEQNNVQLKEDRVKHWLKNGAQPTQTVRTILVKSGLLEATARPAAK